MYFCVFIYYNVYNFWWNFMSFVVVVQSLSCVTLFVTPWTAARQASLSFSSSRACSNSCPSSQWYHPTISSSLIPFSSFLQSFPAVFSNELALHIRWPKYWSFSVSPPNEYSVLISFRIDWLDLLASKGLSRVFSSTIVRKHQFFGTQPSLWSNSHIHTWVLERP